MNRRALLAGLACAWVLAATAAAHQVTLTREAVDADLPRVRALEPARPPLGSVLVVHGGGWHAVGPQRLDRIAPWAQRIRAWGYEVWSTTYRPGRDSLADVLAVYDALRASAPQRRTCLYGQSAGGHLALMVASRRPDVAGVISAAGPTDLTDLPAATKELARHAFGPQLGRYSPLRSAARIRARLLLEYASWDRMVPLSQGARMAAAARAATLVRVPGWSARARHPTGVRRWVHGRVTDETARRMAARERRWLAATCAG